ncbi:MAG: ATP-binding protein [Okeania sp.]|nr:ATP-binding protein [Okeania sp.]
MLNSIGIRRKIGLSYAMAISIATVGILMGCILELTYKHQVRIQIEQAQEQLDLLTNLTKKVLKISISPKDLPSLINTNNRTVLEKKISLELSNFYEVSAIFKQLESILKIASPNVSKNTDNLLFQEFIQTYFNPINIHIQQLESLIQKIKQTPPPTKLETASLSKITNSEVAIKLEKLSQDSQQLVIVTNQRIEQGFKDYQKVETLKTQILIISLLLSVLAAIIFSIYTSKLITSPLKQITEVAEKVTQEANFELQLPITTDDEIGELTVSLNQLICKVAEYTEQLQESKLKAETANLSKSAFLATMSHELRTPLNAIIGYSDLLCENAVEEGYDDLMPDLEKIKRSAKHLLEMISDILDISKIEAGQVTLYLESIDVNKLVQDVVCTSQNLIEKNSNKFELVLGENLGDIYADMPKVRQVLINLLGNAAKFTQNGLVTLSVEKVKNKRVRSNQNLGLLNQENYIVFRVIDTGIGMKEEQLQQIFKPFIQADASTTRKYGGTGLGLAISKRLCERMGAEIYVQSIVGKGSTFTVLFPERVIM